MLCAFSTSLVLVCFKIEHVCTSHRRHCASLMGPLHDHNAKVYGIQRDSILNTSNFFHVAEGLSLVPDIMHDILEGCAQYEVKELLKHLHQDNVVTLDYVNDQIKTFPYSTPDSRNKPSAISGTTFKSPDHSVKEKGPYLSYSIEYIYLSITCFFFSRTDVVSM